MGAMRPVGRISKLFGSKGELIAGLYDAFPAGFTIEEPLFVEIDGLAVPFYLERFERRGRNGALIVFADLDNETRAGELVGMEFSVEDGGNDEGGRGASGRGNRNGKITDRDSGRDAGIARGDNFRDGAGLQTGLQNEDENDGEDDFLLEDLVGFTAQLGGGYTGIVEEFIDGENPLFRVVCDGRDVLIPAADELIASFDPDPERREIVFDLPEGLLDLYLE